MLMVVMLDLKRVMHAAEYGHIVFADAELVAGVQLLVAYETLEAAQVEYRVAGTHY